MSWKLESQFTDIASEPLVNMALGKLEKGQIIEIKRGANFGGPVVRRQKNSPKFGRMGCAR